MLTPRDAAPDTDKLPAGAPSLGQSVGRGLSWMVAGTLLAKGAAFLTQVVLGWMLSQGDFGVYGTALAVSGLVGIFRDGGVREYLVQRGAAEYRALLGPVFWLAVTLSLATGAVLAACSPLLARLYGDDRLVALLLVIAASLPLSTPAAVLQTRLRVELRFGVLSRIAVVSSALRAGLTILLALLGFGPMSFVLPLFGIALYEGVAAYAATRDRPWRLPARVRTWGGLLARTKWLVFSSLAGIVLDFGAFAVLALIVDEGVVGVFYFALNLVAQVGVLLSFNVQQVLFPALARLGDEPDRLREASLRALRALMLAGSAVSLLLAAVADPLEAFLWQGRWEAAVPAIQVLGVLFPFRVSFGLTAAVMLAEGRFRRYSVLTLLEGLAITAGAAVAAALVGSATTIALGAGLVMAAGRAAVTGIELGRLGAPPPRTAAAMAPWWLLALGSAAVALLLDRAAGPGLEALLPSGSPGGGRAPLLALLAVQAVRGSLIAAAFLALFAGGARLLLPGPLADALAVGPARAARVARRALRLPEPGPAPAGDRVGSVPDEA
ncbi:MAG TPA: oligosaccharide flippase family protein [Phycisphaerales bacterium]|nr:oligosaccharide flippase family protein [Phycisphaerales bacterium]